MRKKPYKNKIVKQISDSCFKWTKAQCVLKIHDCMSRCVNKFRVASPKTSSRALGINELEITAKYKGHQSWKLSKYPESSLKMASLMP